MPLSEEKNNMRVVKVIMSLSVTLAIMMAIFLFSAQTGGESGSLSDTLARFLASVFVPGYDMMGAEERAVLISRLSWPIRKTAHASEYACLTMSLVITCWQIHAWHNDHRQCKRPLPTRIVRVGLVAFAISVFYACTDETHQLFIDGRAGQFTDVLVDASGAAVGCLLCCLLMYAFLKGREGHAAEA